MYKINKGDAHKLFRQVVPESDYEECKGCHTGSAKCFVVHYLHQNCPCNNCLIKTSCSEYCDKYIGCIINIARENIDKFRLLYIDKRGYAIEFDVDGIKVISKKILKRWIPDTPAAGTLKGMINNLSKI